MSFLLEKAVQEPAEAYHANPAISRSMIATACESAYHYKYYYLMGNKKEETPAMKFGQIAHLAMLETEEFNRRFVVEPKFSGKGAHAAYDAWAASLPKDTIILSEKEHESLKGMCLALQDEEHFGHVVRFLKKPGIKEYSFYFTDPVTGLKCRFRPDFLTEDGWIMDLKTTTKSKESAFKRGIQDNGYHIQAAFYCFGFEQVFGYKPKGYVFLPIEKKPPYMPTILTADSTILGSGEVDFRLGLNRIKEAMDKNFWPGYQTAPENVSLPAYQLHDYEDVLP